MLFQLLLHLRSSTIHYLGARFTHHCGKSLLYDRFDFLIVLRIAAAIEAIIVAAALSRSKMCLTLTKVLNHIK